MSAGSFSTNFKVTGKIIPVCIEAAQVIQTKKKQNRNTFPTSDKSSHAINYRLIVYWSKTRAGEKHPLNNAEN